MTPIAAIPFLLIGGAQPLVAVPVFVNERGPYQFVVDTGAGPTLLAPHLASELGVESTGTKEGRGQAQVVTVQLARVNSLRLGDEERRPMEVAVTADVDRIARAVNARIDGVVGHSFLGDQVVIVDYPRGTFGLAQAVPVEHGEVVLPFHLVAPAKPLLVVAAKIDGQGPFQLAVDTGASTTLIDRDLARRLGLALVPIPAVTGGGGTAEAATGRLQQLALGAAVQRDLDVVVSSLAGLNAALGAQLDGIVGYNFLRAFRVVIDYPKEQLRLR